MDVEKSVNVGYKAWGAQKSVMIAISGEKVSVSGSNYCANGIVFSRDMWCEKCPEKRIVNVPEIKRLRSISEVTRMDGVGNENCS